MPALQTESRKAVADGAYVSERLALRNLAFGVGLYACPDFILQKISGTCYTKIFNPSFHDLKTHPAPLHELFWYIHNKRCIASIPV